jgi:toxin ParE1/3/4
MRRYVLSPRAHADLSGIWDYTAKHWGVDQAERYVRQIVAACADLAGGRKQGRSIDEVRPGYFKCAIGSHVLFYRLKPAGRIEVVRILHGRMDVERHL